MLGADEFKAVEAEVVGADLISILPPTCSRIVLVRARSRPRPVLVKTSSSVVLVKGLKRLCLTSAGTPGHGQLWPAW